MNKLLCPTEVGGLIGTRGSVTGHHISKCTIMPTRIKSDKKKMSNQDWTLYSRLKIKSVDFISNSFY